MADKELLLLLLKIPHWRDLYLVQGELEAKLQITYPSAAKPKLVGWLYLVSGASPILS